MSQASPVLTPTDHAPTPLRPGVALQSLPDRIAELNKAAAVLTAELLDNTLNSMRATSEMLHDLSMAGEGVPVGIRTRAKQVSDSLLDEIQQLVALRNRTGG